MEIDKFNELYNVQPIKISYESYNEAYQIFYGIQLKENENGNFERVFNSYVYLKDAIGKTNEEIIKMGYENIKDNILISMNNINAFNNLLMKNINI